MAVYAKFGEDNPFYGKHHTKEVRDKIGKLTRERYSDPAYREKMRLVHAGVHHAGEQNFAVSIKLLKFHNPDEIVNKLLDKSWLFEEYITKEKSVNELSRSLGVASETIKNMLRHHEIPLRDKKASLNTRRLKNKRREYFETHINPMDNPDSRSKLQGKNHPLYGKTHSAKAREKISKNHADVSGKNNPRWNGGSSTLPYCHKFNLSMREEIRRRFDYVCFECGRHQSECKRAHSVHHIDYNKVQGCKGQRWALIPLCEHCHPKTNSDKWFWFNKYINYWATNAEINFNHT